MTEFRKENAPKTIYVMTSELAYEIFQGQK